MSEIVYHKISREDNIDQIIDDFCKEHGDDQHGIVPDNEYDILYDHLGSIISKYASYSDDGPEADFMGSRYVDQIPFIAIVADDNSSPAIAVKAAIEAINSTHRPLSVSFDYYPEQLYIFPPNLVYSSFELATLNQDQSNETK